MQAKTDEKDTSLGFREWATIEIVSYNLQSAPSVYSNFVHKWQKQYLLWFNRPYCLEYTCSDEQSTEQNSILPYATDQEISMLH